MSLASTTKHIWSTFIDDGLEPSVLLHIFFLADLSLLHYVHMARTPATTCSLLYDVAKNMTLRQSEKCEVLRTSVANNV